jgi:membrane-bound lytic murein transglycosylase A
MRRSWRILVLSVLASVTACTHVPPPGIGEAISWAQLPGWNEDSQAQAWPALLANCRIMATRDPMWKSPCDEAVALTEVNDVAARAFFEKYFLPYVVYADEGRTDGLITGYYEPLLHGSRNRSERYRYPVYARPDDLLTIELGDLYPELKGKRVRGRLDGKRVVPYLSRAQIDSKWENGKRPATTIVWVDDQVALFFLQVQGSGRVQMPDGSMIYLGYSDQNGHPYRSIGRRLVDSGAMKLEDVSMQSIREWIDANPGEAKRLLNENPSYIFFEERHDELPGPLGAMTLPLYAERAVAVDPTYIPLGSPVWLDTTLPDEALPYQRLAFAQDTGGAIRGPVRADVFFGFGERAEHVAGRMKQPGRLFVLRPVPTLTPQLGQ